MADMKTPGAVYVDDKLHPVNTTDSYADEDLKQPATRIDYSGACEKTDPAEIALVRKLDRWIMPTCASPVPTPIELQC